MNEKINILHLEDDVDIHPYVKTLLEDIANVTSVISAKEFEESLTACKFDLFLLDLVFRDGSGSRMARTLKRDHPDTPIVILSTHDVTDAIEEAEASFVKGKVDTKVFIKTIKKLAS